MTLGTVVGVTIRLFGGFTVTVDGAAISPSAWRQRARHLVALLALQPDHRLHREQVASTLWPHLDRAAGLANLHKAAHLVRRATGDTRAVVLAAGMVELWPDRDIEVDAVEFEDRARRAIRDGADDADRRRVAASHRTGLLVEDLYEPWTQEPRTRLRLLHDQLVATEPQPADTDAPAGGLIGRATELAHLRAARERAAGGQPTLVLLRGPAGIGTTALLEATITDARRSGWAVWHGLGDRAGGPYACLRDGLEAAITGDGVAELLEPDDVATLARAIGTVPDVPDPPPPRHAVLAALRRTATAVADQQGLLIALDDVEQVDEATAEFLRMMGGARGRALLVCLAGRAVPVGSPLETVIATLARSGGRIIDVGPLDGDDVTALLAQVLRTRPDPELVATVARRSGCVPLLVGILGRLAAGAAAPERGPAMARIAAGLAGGDRELAGDLRLVACAGTVDVDVLPALAGSAERADRVLATGAFDRVGSTHRWRHRMLRDAFLTDLSDHRRTELHAVVAERLAAAGGPHEEIARHLLAAGREAEAVPHLARAADAAAALAAWADALALVETALDHRPDDPALLARRAQLAFLTGDPGAGLAFGRAAASATGAAARELRLGQAWALLSTGDLDGALGALAEVPADGEPSSAREATVRGMVACFAGDLDRGRELAEVARVLAQRDGRRDHVVDAAFVSGMVAHARGELPARLRDDVLATEALPIVAGAVHDGYLCPAQTWLYSGEPIGEVARFAARLRDAAVEAGATRGEAFASLLQGQALRLAGNFRDAAAALSDARELHDAVGSPAGETLALVNLARLATVTGRPDEAHPLLATAFDAARRSPLTTWHLLPQIHGAGVSAAPDLHEAVARIDEATAAMRGPEDRCPACWLVFAIPATIAVARAGHPGDAAGLLGQAEAIVASRWRRGGWVAGLDEARAWLTRDTDPSAAVDHLAIAAAEYDRCGQLPDATRCRALLDSWS